MVYLGLMTREKSEKRTKGFHVRLSPRVWDLMREVLDRKRIDNTAAVNQIIDWFVEQDDLVQSMVLGQITATPELVSMLLKRFQEQARKTA